MLLKNELTVLSYEKSKSERQAGLRKIENDFDFKFSKNSKIKRRITNGRYSSGSSGIGLKF